MYLTLQRFTNMLYSIDYCIYVYLPYIHLYYNKYISIPSHTVCYISPSLKYVVMVIHNMVCVNESKIIHSFSIMAILTIILPPND